MASLLDFLPVYERTTDDIRASLDADVNMGVDPSSSAYIDTTEGGIYWDITQAFVLEMARLWDFASVEVPAATWPEFAWGPYLDEWGTTVDLARKPSTVAQGTVRFTGAVGSLIGSDTRVATAQTDADVAPPEFRTTASGTIPAGGTLDLAVSAVNAGSAGNVAVGTITQLVSPVAGLASLTNLAATSGGTEVETDDEYRERILLEMASAAGGGNVADYRKWALEEPGVGHVTVVPLSTGPGTVAVVITDAANNPVPAGVVTSLQSRLDPVAAQGAGQAPIGAAVTVSTPTLLAVNVTATVTYVAGYSKDGAGGTIAIGQAITDALAQYIDNLAPGDDVILNHVEAQFFRVVGVFNVASVQLNGAAANLVVSTTQVASMGTVTLS